MLHRSPTPKTIFLMLGLVMMLVLPGISQAIEPSVDPIGETADVNMVAKPAADLDTVAQLPSTLSAAFVENVGQFDSSARYHGVLGAQGVWITDEAVLINIDVGAQGRSGTNFATPSQTAWDVQTEPSVISLRLSFVDGNSARKIEPFGSIDTKVSYLKGADRSGWFQDIPAWRGVRYRDVYPGIDLELLYDGPGLAIRWRVGAKADSSQLLALRVGGAEALQVSGESLKVMSDFSSAAIRLPRATDESGAILPLDSKLIKHGMAEFELQSVLAGRVGTLLDVTIASAASSPEYATYLGGINVDRVEDIAVDENGSAYLVGYTYSSNFPARNGFDTSFNPDFEGMSDTFVVKLSSDGQYVEYATFLGGSYHSHGFGIDIDDNGCAYVVGSTSSPDFPVGPGYDLTKAGSLSMQVAFATKLAPDGQSIVYSTFLGGGDGAIAEGVAVDASGCAYVCGWVPGSGDSSAFPVGPGADTTYAGGRDGFAVKLSADGQHLEYSSFIGGYALEKMHGIAVDAAGQAYVVGDTTTPGYGSGWAGPQSALLVKLSADGQHFDYRVCWGGSSTGAEVALDQVGAAYITGYAFSPYQAGPGYDTSFGGYSDSFVAKFGPAGERKYSTYLGGTEKDMAFSIAVDGEGRAAIAGHTLSPEYPVVQPYCATYPGPARAVVSVLSADGMDLLYSTFTTIHTADWGTVLDLDEQGNVYLAGEARSLTVLPVEGIDNSYNGGTSDAFVMKLPIDPLAPNHPPSLAPDHPFTVCSAGEVAASQGTVFDADGDDVLLTSSLGEVTNNADGTWHWTWLSEPVAGGALTVTITADDGQDTASCEFLVVVSSGECLDRESAAIDHRSYLFRPGLATDGTTLWVVTESGSPARALFSMSHDAGSTWSTPVYVSGDLTWARDPGIYMDPSGTLWAYWRMRDLGGIWYARSEDYGYTWSEPDVLVNDGYDDWAPEMIEYDGVLYLFSHLAQFSASGRLGYRASSDGGATWSARQSLPIAWSSRARNTTPMVDDQNRLWLIWLDEDGERDVHVAHSTGDMQSWSTPVQVSLVSEFDSAPSMVQDANGTFWAFWPSAPSQSVASVHNQLYYATSEDGCATWSVPQPYVVSDQSDGSPRAFVLDSGAIGIGWERHYNTSWTDTRIMVRTDCVQALPVAVVCDQPMVSVAKGDVAYASGTYTGQDVALSVNAGQIVANEDGTWTWLIQTDCTTLDQTVDIMADGSNGVIASCQFQLVMIPDTCHGEVTPAIDHETDLYRPDMASDGEKTLWVVSEAGSPSKILLTMSQDAGTTWSAPYVLSGNLAWARDPGIGLDSSGRLWAVWRMRDLGEIWFSRSDDGGFTWSEPAVLISDGLDDWSPRVIDYNGRLYVFSHQNQFSAGGRLGYRVSDDDGATWSSYTQLPAVWSEHAWYGSPYVDQQNRLWLIWTTTDFYPQRDVYLAHGSGALETWSTPVRVSVSLENDGTPSLTQSVDGTFYAFWPSAEGGDSDIYYSISGDAGGTWSEPMLCVDTPLLDGTPHAKALADGTVAFLWDHQNAGGYDYSLLYTTLNKGTSRPIVRSDQSSVNADEGIMAVATGTYVDSACGPSSLTGGVGNVVNNGDGTWQWSYQTSDGPEESQTVTITADDGFGGVTSVSFELVVENVVPLFEAGEDESLEPPQLGLLGRHGIAFTDPGADVWSGTVSWGDGSDGEALVVDQAAKSFDLQHTYIGEGAFTVTVALHDEDGGEHQDTFQVTVHLNTPPTAAAGGPYSVSEGGMVQLDGSGSTDEQQDPATLDYAWDLDGDGDYNDAYGISPSFSAALLDGPDSVTVSLQVTDDYGVSDRDTAEITVRNVSPTAVDDTAMVSEDGPATVVDVLANDSDPAGTADPLTVVSLDTTGTKGAATLVDGVVSYDPAGAFAHLAAGAEDADSFWYDITDGDGGNASATVVVTVEGVNDAPTLTVNQASVTVDEGQVAINSGTWFDVDDGAVVSLSVSVGDVARNEDGTWAWSWQSDDGPVESQEVTITADDGLAAMTITFALTVDNVAPVAAFSVDSLVIGEGEMATLLLADAYDPSNADTAAGFLYAFDCTDDGNWEQENSAADQYSCAYAQDGTYTVRGRISDKDGGATEYTADLIVENRCPVIEEIVAPIDPLEVMGEVTVSALFSDPGVFDTHSATWDWGDGSTTPGEVAEAGGSGTVTGHHVYETPGVYRVILSVMDDAGCESTAVFEYVVIYDPEGGFVTGGGWIDSPEGAYAADPTLTGKATFGFVSKYKKGATVPTGRTAFQFKVGDLSFYSESYDWLVVAGAKAKFKGVGSINGEGNYGFMISAIDAKLTPSTDTDLFRIKIWDRDAGDAPVYDNQLGAEEDADPTTTLGGGSIVVQQAK